MLEVLQHVHARQQEVCSAMLCGVPFFGPCSDSSCSMATGCWPSWVGSEPWPDASPAGRSPALVQRMVICHKAIRRQQDWHRMARGWQLGLYHHLYVVSLA
jgi:hypothetical protein